MKIAWLHNNPDRASGTFMWDIFDRLENPVHGLSVNEVSIPVVRSIKGLRKAFRAATFARDLSLIHAQYGALVGALGAMQRRSPLVVTLRGSDIYWRYGSARNRFASLLRCFLSWFASLRSEVTVVMSHRMAGRVRSWPGHRRRTVVFIPDPAGDIFWPPRALNIAEMLLQQKYRVVIASLKMDNPIKRTGLVEKAMELCRTAGMATELSVLSGIPREHVRSHLERVDSVALASTHEGWPNIIKEGLLLGKNFVATDVGDLAAYAQPGSGNKIVGPTAIEFACAWVDQVADRVLQGAGIPRELVPFHPDVVALKLKLVYIHCAGMQS